MKHALGMLQRLAHKAQGTDAGRNTLLVLLFFAFCLTADGCDGKRAEAEKAHAEGQRFLEQGDFNGAVAPLRTAVRLAPDTPGIVADLGRSVMRSANRQALLIEAQQTLQQKPEDIEALTIASSALLGKDDERKRLGYLRTLVRLRPKDTLLKVTLAQELVNSFLYDEARPLLEDLIKIEPDNPAGYFLRGQANYFQKPNAEGLSQAEKDFQKTLELKANVGRTQLYLGRVKLRQGKPPEAIDHLAAASESIPDSPDVHFEIAKAFRAAGDKEQADRAQAEFVRLREQATLTEAMAKRCGAFPNDFDLHLKTARLMMKKGDTDKAIYYVNRALTIRPNDPEGQAAARELDAILNGGGRR